MLFATRITPIYYVCIILCTTFSSCERHQPCRVKDKESRHRRPYTTALSTHFLARDRKQRSIPWTTSFWQNEAKRPLVRPCVLPVFAIRGPMISREVRTRLPEFEGRGCCVFKRRTPRSPRRPGASWRRAHDHDSANESPGIVRSDSLPCMSSPRMRRSVCFLLIHRINKPSDGASRRTTPSHHSRAVPPSPDRRGSRRAHLPVHISVSLTTTTKTHRESRWA